MGNTQNMENCNCFFIFICDIDTVAVSQFPVVMSGKNKKFHFATAKGPRLTHNR